LLISLNPFFFFSFLFSFAFLLASNPYFCQILLASNVFVKRHSPLGAYCGRQATISPATARQSQNPHSLFQTLSITFFRLFCKMSDLLASQADLFLLVNSLCVLWYMHILTTFKEKWQDDSSLSTDSQREQIFSEFVALEILGREVI
jgi:Na+(H+)/acetate symporter ActP